MKRPVIEIDEALCDGCGLCVTSCAEGALTIVNGKAKLISDAYCDGLGACLHCPHGALRLAEREAAAFDEAAALAARAHREGAAPAPTGCPGAAPRVMRQIPPLRAATPQAASGLAAQLATWPVQLRLLPPAAPFLRNARVLLAAHCAGFALPRLHTDWIEGRIPVICCPKLEDKGEIVTRLAAILRQSDLAALNILRMSVRCCCLDALADRALAEAGSALRPTCHVVRL